MHFMFIIHYGDQNGKGMVYTAGNPLKYFFANFTKNLIIIGVNLLWFSHYKPCDNK